VRVQRRCPVSLLSQIRTLPQSRSGPGGFQKSARATELGVRCLAVRGMIACRVVASALLGLPLVAEPAVFARRRLRISRYWCCVTKSPCYAEPTRSPVWTGRIERCSPPWSGPCPRCCAGIVSSRRTRSCAGIVVWQQKKRRIPTVSASTPRRHGGLVDRAYGPGEPELGIPANSGRVIHASVLRLSFPFG
jgi:hypothetical protein